MAERLGKTLSQDAATAVEQMYRDTGERVAEVAKRVEGVDDEHARVFLHLAERMGREEHGRLSAPAPRPSEDGFARRKLRALLDGSPWPPPGAPRIEARAPNTRHQLNRIKPDTPRKAANSVILPHVDVQADVDAINLGQAERFGNDFKVNGRVYCMESNGTLFPRSGDGVVPMSRREYGALQVMIKYADDPQRMATQMGREGYGAAEQEAAARVYEHYRRS